MNSEYFFFFLSKNFEYFLNGDWRVWRVLGQIFNLYKHYKYYT